MSYPFRHIAFTALGSAALIAMFPSEASAQCSDAAPSTDTAAVVVLLDESGSMLADGQCTDGSVQSKWVCGVSDASTWVTLSDPLADRVYFLWRFRTAEGDAELVEIDDGPTGAGYCRDGAVAAINAMAAAGPTNPGPATPLAGAYCDAAQFLTNFKASSGQPDLDLYVKLESDGLENDTPIDHACFGPDSATSAIGELPVSLLPDAIQPATVNRLEIGSWQALMLDVALTGSTHVYSPLEAGAYEAQASSSPIITNVTLWGTFVDTDDGTSGSGSVLIGASGGTPRTLLEGLDPDAPSPQPGDPPVTPVLTATPSSSGEYSTPEEFAAFLAALSSSSGGRFVRAGSGIATAPGDPSAIHGVIGDANDDGCVDSDDSALVSSVFGQAVSSGVPDTFPADLNLDGVVDGKDLIVLNENLGAGCADAADDTSPITAAAFGFESLETWDSDATLSLTGAVKTQGAFAFVVQGSNWREVHSVALDSDDFEASAILAFDLRLPSVPVNPHWLGQTLLFVSSPSAGLNREFVGAVELTGQPLGEFIPVFYSVPEEVLAVLQESHADVSFTIAINSSDPVHHLDNLRFVQ